jgi:hypothetical protein
MANPETTVATPSYIDLSSQAYKLLLETAAASQKRALDYAKSLYEIAARPNPAGGPEAGIREGFERANQIVALTVNELQVAGQRNAEFAEKIIAHAAKAQDSSITSARGVWNTGLSNLNYVKETTNAQIDTFAKRVDEIQKHTANTAAAATSSKN